MPFLHYNCWNWIASCFQTAYDRRCNVCIKWKPGWRLLILSFLTIWQVNASEVIILEGILVFHEQRVRNMMNMKIFVDAGMLLFHFVNRLKLFWDDTWRQFSVIDIVGGFYILLYLLSYMLNLPYMLCRSWCKAFPQNKTWHCWEG